jgi:hypothetical protein
LRARICSGGGGRAMYTKIKPNPTELKEGRL